LRRFGEISIFLFRIMSQNCKFAAQKFRTLLSLKMSP
jgi:hypothetical protein